MPKPTPTSGAHVPRRSRRRGAALLVLALVALLLPAIPVGAGAVEYAGTIRPNSWTIGETSATLELPGDGAGLDPVQVTISSADNLLRFVPTPSAQGPFDVPYIGLTGETVTGRATCLTGATAGDRRNCGTLGRITVTFPQPVVNPLMQLGLGAGASGSPGSCTRASEMLRVVQVNGAAPSADSPTVVYEGTSNHLWDQTTKELSYSRTNIPASCTNGETVARVFLGFSGLVSSIEFELDLLADVVGLNEGAQLVAALGGNSYILPTVPASDLQVTTTAPSVVDADGEVTWDVEVRNNGGAASHGFTVQGAVPAEVTDAALVSAPAGCTFDGTTVDCESAPPNCSVSTNAIVDTLLDLACGLAPQADSPVLAAGATFGTITLSGTAPTARGTVVTGTASVAGVDFDLDVTNNVAAADTTVEAPTLSLGRRVPERVSPADQFQVEASADGATVASVSTSGEQVTVDSAPVQVVRGQEYTITGSMVAGSASESSRYGSQLICVDEEGGLAAVGGTGPWTFTPTENLAYSCVVSSSALPRSFVVQKSAAVATAHPGDTVEYQVLLTNTGSAPYTASDPASFTDDLSGVLDEATYAGDASGGAVVTGSELSWSGALAVGESVAITYSVLVDDTFTGDRVLANTVTTPPGSGGDCLAESRAASCSTRTPVEALAATVQVEKVGERADGGLERLAGAGFELLADDAGAPGAVLTGVGGTETETGLFAFEVLAPGTYWLRETAAPGSYTLLAEPVRFTVAPTGLVTLTDPDAQPQITTHDGTLTVRDLATFELPTAGGQGAQIFYLAGGALLVLATATWAARARRSRSVQQSHLTKESNA